MSNLTDRLPYDLGFASLGEPTRTTTKRVIRELSDLSTEFDGSALEQDGAPVSGVEVAS